MIEEASPGRSVAGGDVIAGGAHDDWVICSTFGQSANLVLVVYPIAYDEICEMNIEAWLRSKQMFPMLWRQAEGVVAFECVGVGYGGVEFRDRPLEV